MSRLGAAAVVLALIAGGDAWAQRAPRVWDIPFGTHVRDLPAAEFVEPSCGTNGGPPSQPLRGFADFGRCAAEASGLREVWFIYDDTAEYVALARRERLVRNATTLLDQPVVLSLLIDGDGRVEGLRIFTDPRAAPELRLDAHRVALAFKARFDVDAAACRGLPVAEGEKPIDGLYVKTLCTAEADGRGVTVEEHFYYKPGQQVVDPQVRRNTLNEFESWARLEVLQVAPLPAANAQAAQAPEQAAGDAMRAAFLSGVGADCPGCDLAGADLRRRDLSDANLAGADLRNALLHRAVLRRANLAGANLEDANLNRANLGFASLRGARLAGAMLYQAEASRADFTGADFEGAALGKANLALAKLDGATLDFADLGEARLNDASLARASLNGAYLSLVVLFRADLRGITAEGATLTEAALRGADLTGAILRGADLFGADLTDAQLQDVDFSNARLLSANLANTKQAGTIFTGALMPDNTLRQ